MHTRSTTDSAVAALQVWTHHAHCETALRRPAVRGVYNEALKAFRGLACYEVAMHGLPRAGSLPVAIVDLSRAGSPSVNMQDFEEIVFPGLLGGAGRNQRALHQHVASALVSGTAPEEIRTTPHLRSVIAANALEHTSKQIAACVTNLAGISACKDPALRQALPEKWLTFLADVAQSPALQGRPGCAHDNAATHD